MITASLNGVELPELEVPLSQDPGEISADVVTLSGVMYTDFVAQTKGWEIGWSSLTEDEYDSIRTIYDEQFSTYNYPVLSIPYYGIDSVPVRMYLNTKEIWNNCGSVQNVKITLREQYPDGTSPDYLLLDAATDYLLLENNERLVL